MATITQYDPVQGDNGAAVSLDLTNDDSGTIYDSGDFDMGEVFGPLASSISEHNPAYTGKTPNELFQDWGISIRDEPTGEVYNGWNYSLGGDNVLGLTGSGRNMDTWKSTSDDPDQDMMALTFSVPRDQLDFNRNGIFDEATESIYKKEQLVPDAFTGYNELGSGVSAPAFSYNVNAIPEPTTGLLLGIAALATLASRRFSGRNH